MKVDLPRRRWKPAALSRHVRCSSVHGQHGNARGSVGDVWRVRGSHHAGDDADAELRSLLRDRGRSQRRIARCEATGKSSQDCYDSHFLAPPPPTPVGVVMGDVALSTIETLRVAHHLAVHDAHTRCHGRRARPRALDASRDVQLLEPRRFFPRVPVRAMPTAQSSPPARVRTTGAGSSATPSARSRSSRAALPAHRRASSQGARRAERAGAAACASRPTTSRSSTATDPACPIRRQCVPDAREADTRSPGDLADPLGEVAHEVAPHLVQRYPDRALLLATDRCAVYCRFCTRSRMVGDGGGARLAGALAPALACLRAHPEVRDVIVSGGDPLAMATDRIVAPRRPPCATSRASRRSASPRASP